MSTLRQKVLAFIAFVAERRGNKLDWLSPNNPKWLKTVGRKRGTGEAIGDSVIRLRQEETW